MKQPKQNEILNEENQYSNNHLKKRNKKSKAKKQRNPIQRFIRKLLLFALILIILSSTLYLGFKGYVFKKLSTEMFNNSPSVIYDSNKKVLAQIGAERNRENINYDEIPQKLVNAYISIEDKRYFSHQGIDIKRTASAIFSYVIHRGSSSFGGSTITQQLVKNLTGDDSATASRKVREWFYALILNFSFSKEEILEAYLNIIYTGPNIYGIKEAALYYFNKDVSELTLEECAYLAGLTNSPNSYNPFLDTDRTERITKRTKTVLNQMLEQGYISQNEYNDALDKVNSGLNFSKGNVEEYNNINSYHTDAVINEVIADLQEKYFISKDFATNYYYLAGTSIYSTVNADIQNKLESELKNSKYILHSSNGTDTSQAAMVVIDHSSRKCSWMCWWPW